MRKPTYDDIKLVRELIADENRLNGKTLAAILKPLDGETYKNATIITGYRITYPAVITSPSKEDDIILSAYDIKTGQLNPKHIEFDRLSKTDRREMAYQIINEFELNTDEIENL